jgi:hypothetical protein
MPFRFAEDVDSQPNTILNPNRSVMSFVHESYFTALGISKHWVDYMLWFSLRCSCGRLKPISPTLRIFRDSLPRVMMGLLGLREFT